MRSKLIFALFTLISLGAPAVVMAEDAIMVTLVGVTTNKSVRVVPPGVAVVQKWVVEQIPGRVFNTKADAIAAGFNASLMRMDLHQVTFIEQATPENVAIAAAANAEDSRVAAK